MDRPKIEVPYEQSDLLVDMINITLLLLIWGFTFVHYSDLPETIPIHFNVNGDADGFGHRATIWLLPAIATFTFLLMFLLNRYPHLHNYMVNITEENALKNYRLSTRLLRYMNLFCLIIFSVVVYDVLSMSMGGEAKLLGVEFMLLTFIVPIAIVIYAFRKQKQINK